jgi:hypothetical protein
VRSAILVLVGVAVGFLFGVGVFELANGSRLDAATEHEGAIAELKQKNATEASEIERLNKSINGDSQYQHDEFLKRSKEREADRETISTLRDSVADLKRQLTIAKSDLDAKAQEIETIKATENLAKATPTDRPNPSASSEKKIDSGSSGKEFKATVATAEWDRDGELLVMGEIQNTTDKRWEAASFNIGVYNDRGELVGTTDEYVRNVFPNQKVPFRTWISHAKLTQNPKFKFFLTDKVDH